MTWSKYYFLIFNKGDSMQFYKIMSLMLVSCLWGYTHAHTGRTFLMPRSQNAYDFIKNVGFKKMIKEHDGDLGGCFQTISFYNLTDDAKRAARYFLVNDKDVITFKLSAARDAAENVIETVSTVTDDIDLGYIFNMGLSNPAFVDEFTAAGATPTLSLAPRLENYGVLLAYHHKLGSTGWVLDMSLPIVSVETDTQFRFTGSTMTSAVQVLAGPPPFLFGDGNPFSIKQNLVQSFTGQPTLVQNVAVDSALRPHTAAKLGRQRSVGAADLDVKLGYQLVDTPTRHLTIGVGVTAPMGNRPTGEFVFEAIRGNGRHWAAGGDMAFDVRMWGDCEHNITFNASMQHRYLFVTEQKRTLGLLGRRFGQHYSLIKNDYVANTGLTPAANVLTLPVDVTGRSQCDSVVSFTYNNHALTCDLGYNFYYRDAENVKQRKSFADNTWYVPARGFPSITNDFDLATPEFFDGGSPASAVVNDSTIDVKAAATPTQVTHSLFASLGYLFDREKENPWMLGMGGKYEMASRNSAMDNWGVWVKAGVGF